MHGIKIRGMDGKNVFNVKGLNDRFGGDQRWVGLFMALLLLLAYTPLITGTSTLKWDALDCYLPWRWFVVHAIRNGIFPLWNPYQHLGYPIYADLRSVFSIEPYLVSLAGEYSLPLLHLIFLFYLWLAGMGFFRLTGHFLQHPLARVITAVAYMLSGFFVAHGQELFGLAASALMPWVLFYFIRLQRLKNYGDLWKLALVLFLLLTGGYQALSIILFYLLVFIFLVIFASHVIKLEKTEVIKLLSLNMLLAVVVVCSIAMLWVAWLQAKPFVARMSGITLQDAWFMPFSPQSLLSLLTPFATIGNPEFWNTDVSMNNLYFGVTLLAFVAVGFRAKSKSTLWVIFLFWGTLCLLASMGAYTPVREWLYRYGPLMNLFRMSAWFSWFAMVPLILTAGRGLEAFFDAPDKNLKILWGMLGLIGLVLLITLLLNLKNIPGALQLMLSDKSLHQKVNEATLGQRFALNALLQILFLSILGGLLWKRHIWKSSLPLGVGLLIAMDLLFSVRLNFYGTVGSQYKLNQIQEILDRSPRGFPLPDLQSPLSLFPDNQRRTAPLWRNTHIFSSTVSAEGFNSFRLDAYDNLTSRNLELYKAILSNPLMYFTDDVHPWGDSSFVTINKSTCFVDDEVYESFQDDFSIEGARVRLKQFRPGAMTAITQTSQPAILVCSQAWFPGWKATLDGKTCDILRVNGFQMGLVVPAGRYEVVFKYESPIFMMAFGFTALWFFIILGAALYLGLKIKYRILLALGLPVLLFAWICMVWGRQSLPYKRRANIVSRGLSRIEQIGDRNIVLITTGGNSYLVDSVVENLGLPVYTLHLGPCPELQLQKLDSLLDHRQPEIVYYWKDDAFEGFKLEDYLIRQYPACDTLWEKSKMILFRFHPQGRKTVIYEGDLKPLMTVLSKTIQPGAENPAMRPGGILAYKMDSLHPGSPSLNYTLPKGFMGKKLRVVASSHLFLSPGAGATLYIQMLDRAEVIGQSALSSREIGIPFQKRALLAQTTQFSLPGELKEPEIRVFLWMNGSQPLWVEDIQVGIYPAR